MHSWPYLPKSTRLWRTVLQAGGPKFSTFAGGGGGGCGLWGSFVGWLLGCCFAGWGGAYGLIPAGCRCVTGIILRGQGGGGE